MELKARFDERANIRWAKKLEQAGVHVVYGIPALKTHVKCVLVVRREGDGVRHYVHIGTGNYNPKTARIYTDLGLFTCDPEIGADIAEMFNSLTGYARPRSYREVLVAPFNLQKGILEEIDRTIESHSPETPGADPAEDELAARRAVDPGALPRLAGGGRGARSTCAASAPCARACRASRRTSRSLGRRPLPRALADLLVRARRRAGERLHRLRRPDAAQPLQPGRAGDAGAATTRLAPSCSTSSTARSPTTRTPGSSTPTASGSGASPATTSPATSSAR